MYHNLGQAPPLGGAISNPSGGIRLKFLTAEDQAKFEDLFSRAAASTGGRNVPALAARDILTRSRLDNESLAKIWDLASIGEAPYLTFPEFALAMYLTSAKLTGKPIPPSLPPAIREEVELAMATIASTETATRPPPPPPASNFMQQPMMTGAPVQIPAMTGVMTTMQPSFNNNMQMMQPPSVQTPMRTAIAPPMHNDNKPRLGNQDFASRMMPNQNGTVNLLAGPGGPSSSISWKISPEEKQRYREIFYAWNSPGSEYMSGELAKQVLIQSQLPEQDLMKIWSLADRENRGSLDVDEFAVAMHLIYRKLNNFEIPSVLPPELQPPSSVLKKFVIGRQQPPPSPRSIPAQQHNINTNTTNTTSTFHDETDDAYVSSARRKGPASRFLSASAARPRHHLSYEEEEEEDDYNPRLDELRAQIAEMKASLDRLSSKASPSREPASSRYSIEELKEKIRKTHEELMRAKKSNPMSEKYFRNTEILLDLLETQKTLQDEIQYLCNRDIPVLARQLRGAAAELRDTKVRYARKNDGSQDYMAFIEPTGPGGTVTESDRVRAKAKAMMAARKAGTSSSRDASHDLRKAEQEKEEYDRQADAYEREMERARDALRDLRGDLRYLSGLAESKMVVDKKRFEKGQDLSYELRRFIEQLERDVSLFGVSPPSSPATKYTEPSLSPSAVNPTPSPQSPKPPASPSRPRTAEEIKKEAERRVQERLAALQAKRSPKPSPSPAKSPVPDHEEIAAQQRLREAERQAQERLRQSEMMRQESERQAQEEAAAAAERERQRIQQQEEEERRRKQQEEEEERELEARKRAVLEREEQQRLARLEAIQRAQEEEERREAERRREEELAKAKLVGQQQQPSSSSVPPPPPPPPPAAPSEPVKTEDVPASPPLPPSSAAAPSEPAKTEDVPAPPPPTTTTATVDNTRTSRMSSNNPFAKLQQQEKKKEEEEEQPVSPVSNTKRMSYNPFAAFSAFSATKAGNDESDSDDDDDGWDVVHHDDTDDEDEFPAAGSAKNLAGMLFDAMSQRQQQQKSTSPSLSSAAAPAAPPAPAPPTTTTDLPAAPSAGGRSALLSQIQQGTKLRKTVTNDRSGAALAGRVLNSASSTDVIPPQPTAPSEADHVSSSTTAESAPEKEYIALWAYNGQGEDDLSFDQDAKILVQNDDPDQDWWYGRLASDSNKKGFFPKSYVKDARATLQLQAKALYDFEGPAEEGCLSFHAGASLVILEKDEEDWWKAEIPETGRTGLVPANYVQLED